MDLSRKTCQEIEALLRLLVEWARKEISLLMLKRHMAARHGHAHRGSRKLWQLAGFVADWLEQSPRGRGAPG